MLIALIPVMIIVPIRVPVNVRVLVMMNVLMHVVMIVIRHVPGIVPITVLTIALAHVTECVPKIVVMTVHQRVQPRVPGVVMAGVRVIAAADVFGNAVVAVQRALLHVLGAVPVAPQVARALVADNVPVHRLADSIKTTGEVISEFL